MSDCFLSVLGRSGRWPTTPSASLSDGASFDSSETVKTFPFSWDCSSFSTPWPVSGSGSLRRNFPASRCLCMIGLVALTLFRTSAWRGCERVICRFFLPKFSRQSSVPVLYTYEMYQCFMAECSGRLHQDPCGLKFNLSPLRLWVFLPSWPRTNYTKRDRNPPYGRRRPRSNLNPGYQMDCE